MRVSQLSVPGIVLALAAPAAAQDRPPDWLKKPTQSDLEAVWPAQALKQGYGGKATISCVLTVQGALRDCQVRSESPAGGGFGSAALVLASQFMMRPQLQGGKPVESTVTIPINFPKPDKATGSHIRPNTDTDLPRERVYTGLPWRAAPTYADLMAAYPAKAREAQASGAVTLDCRVEKTGGLSGCRKLREEPERLGFADAARTLAPRFSTPTTDSQGQSIAGSRVHLRVSFDSKMLTSPLIGKPKWVGLPQVNDMSAVIPEAARKAGVYKSRVVLECGVITDGAVDQCQVLSQEPDGLGYGDAAVALSKFFRLAVWTEEGLPVVGGRVRIPLRFDAQPPATASAGAKSD